MPYGPHKITKVRQVAIPAELLHAVGLEVGDFIHYRLSDHDPYVIEIIPSDVLERRYGQERIRKPWNAWANHRPQTTCSLTEAIETLDPSEPTHAHWLRACVDRGSRDSGTLTPKACISAGFIRALPAL